MARSGRPRINLEKKILAEMSEEIAQGEAMIASKIDLNRPGILASEAACLVLRIERGADPQAGQGTATSQRLNRYARMHGPPGMWRGAREFLEEFVQSY